MNPEVLTQVYKACNLETCVELSEVSKAHRELWRSLDSTMVREKVLERAPWFSLDESASGTGLDTWHKCALMVINRTEQSLDARNKMLYVIKHLQVAVTLCRNKVEMVKPVDVSTDHKLRESMDPMFDGYSDSHIDVLDDGTSQGTKLMAVGCEVDLKTLKVKPNKFEADPNIRYSEIKDEAVSPSGLKVRHEMRGNWIRVVDENEHLIHVRMKGVEILPTDVLVHKETHEKDENGTFIVSFHESPYYPGQIVPADDIDEEVSLVSLLPSGGALVVTNPYGHPEIQYLAYVEPLPGLPRVLLCFVPLGMGFKNNYTESECSRFSVCYDGYLHVYFEGRFLRLWVDLGRRASFDPANKRDKTLMTEELHGQALTVWDRDFPAIGTLNGQVEYAVTPTWVSTSSDGRYVTVGAAEGRLVGDLLTGVTYCSDVDGLSIPFMDKKNDRPGFYTADTGLVRSVVREMALRRDTKTEIDVSRCWDPSSAVPAERGGESDPFILQDTGHDFANNSRDPVMELYGGTLSDGEYADDDDEESDEEEEEQHDIYQNRPPLRLGGSTLSPPRRYKEVKDHLLCWTEYYR